MDGSFQECPVQGWNKGPFQLMPRLLHINMDKA